MFITNCTHLKLICNKIQKLVCMFTTPVEGVFGKTGEPLVTDNLLVGQRVRSTRLSERNLVTGKRSIKRAAGKEPKSIDTKHNSLCKVDVAYQDRTVPVPPRSDEPASKGQSWSDRVRALRSLSPHNKGERLFKLLSEGCIWTAAYKNLTPSSGSMTKGGEGGIIDGTSLILLEKLKNRVCKGTWKWGLTRRVDILKAKGGTRPLEIPFFEDRIVEKVIKTVLEPLYEPIFCDNSHGFRPGRSQHTCLRQIRRDFRGTVWYIEGNISKCFDTTDHAVLMNLLRLRIRDHKFLELIQTGLKSNVLLKDGRVEKRLVGTPETGVVSPLLSNVVLHQLDLFLMRLQRIIDRGAERRKSKVNDILCKRRYRPRKKKDKKLATRLLQSSRKVGYGDPMDPNFRRLFFTRYADDFLIGIVGPKELALKVRKLVYLFLRIRLKVGLDIENTLISRAKGGSIPFLGYLITQSPPVKHVSTRSYKAQGIRKIPVIRRTSIRLLVDVQKIIASLSEKGFCDKSGAPKPNFRYFQEPQSYTVNRVAAILRGISNYYHLSESKRKVISRIAIICTNSIAMMFAAKFKLRSRARVFQRAGKDLSKLITARPGKTPIKSTDQLYVTQIEDNARTRMQRPLESMGGKLNLRSQKAFGKIPFLKSRDVPLPYLAPLARDMSFEIRLQRDKDPSINAGWPGH